MIETEKRILPSFAITSLQPHHSRVPSAGPRCPQLLFFIYNSRKKCHYSRNLIIKLKLKKLNNMTSLFVFLLYRKIRPAMFSLY